MNARPGFEEALILLTATGSQATQTLTLHTPASRKTKPAVYTWATDFSGKTPLQVCLFHSSLLQGSFGSWLVVSLLPHHDTF